MRIRLRQLLVPFGILVFWTSINLYAQPVVTISPTSLTFATQAVGTQSAAQSITLTNTGNADLHISVIVMSGAFNGDFLQTNNCPSALPPNTPCTILVAFSPTGTGTRSASLLIFDDAFGSPQVALLAGPGQGNITHLSSSAYQLLNARTAANQSAFYVYLDQDSGFNHGFPSGKFANNNDVSGIDVDAGCLNNPADLLNGCMPPSDGTDFDATRGTVFRLSFSNVQGFSGLNIEEPQNWGVLYANGMCGVTTTCFGYDLRGADRVEFDVRSPTGISGVQFGVGQCQIQTPISLPASPAFQHMRIPMGMFTLCTGGSPNLANVNVLFTVVTTQSGTLLLDNLQFLPTPSRSGQAPGETLSFPFSTQSFGVVPQSGGLQDPIPPDQNNRNMTTTYESALTMLALLHRGQSGDIANAIEIANAFDYTLFHDNHGDPTPQSPMNQAGCYLRAGATSCGLHSAYEEGDVGLFNDQNSGGLGKAGDVRLAGFSVPAGSSLCGTSMFCLVQDGATGGNNAFAILALASAYQQTGNMTFLNDALIIGNWIVGLKDPDTRGYGGYFVGYSGFSDPGPVHTLIPGKSTENNADIFAAFSFLAQIEAGLGNSGAAAQWTMYANVAGDFVLAMYDPLNNFFNAGTVQTMMGGPGICPDGPMRGNDIINTCPFLDTQSFPTLELAGSAMYGVPNPSSINWQLPTEFVMNYSSQGQVFTQNITAAGINYSGFDLVPAPAMSGDAWEFTGQMVSACMYLDLLYNVGGFQSCVTQYQSQILEAANNSPFGDGVGVVAATLQNGDMIGPGMQCLQTPFQCIPERVGLAATSWAIFSDLGYDPLSFPSLTVNVSGSGTGTVVSQDGLINCGTVCSHSYYSGTLVTLTANPTPGSFFAGWTGCDSMIENTCIVTTVINKSVTAMFALNNGFYILSVSTLGNGTVTSTDGLINCGSTCSHQYPPGTPVTLNAQPVQGSTFGGWSGACSGTGPCNVVMTQAQEVTGYFNHAVQFVPVMPCRLADTRGNPILAGNYRNFVPPQLGGCNIPSSAVGYSLNVTVVPHGSLNYLTIWPAGAAQPAVSTMNSPDGRIKANAGDRAGGRRWRGERLCYEHDRRRSGH